ncbi:MAG: sugar phosphate isomerase/epimerase [Candidatus Latescibacteria bacterium]|nr:sugar phosphate isomerase/epimerase [Candidatus Latescibacterota bacterium]
MPKRITRRQALTAGTATGITLGISKRNAQAEPLSDVWGEDFMMQWSPPEHVKRDLTPGNSHIRLSCAGYGLRKDDSVTLVDQIKAVRKAGYTAVEASSRTWDYDITDSGIRELQAVLKEVDVQFYTLHTWVNIIDPDATKRRENQKHVAQAVEAADRLGMKFILTHIGGRSPVNKDIPHKDNWTKETWEMSVTATKQILKDTSGSKVCLAFEAVNSCNNNTPKSHVRLKQDVGDERVKVTLDPANMLHAGTFYRMTELINECFDLLGEDIMYAHAKDKEWTKMMPSIESVIIGKGCMDYEQYLAQLSRMKYPRTMLIEHLPKEQYPPSKKHLEDTAKKIGVKIYQ